MIIDTLLAFLEAEIVCSYNRKVKNPTLTAFVISQVVVIQLNSVL
jgi:hypothetical protein